MKKILLVVLSLAIVLSAVACTQAPETTGSLSTTRGTGSPGTESKQSTPAGISSLEGSPDDVIEKLNWAKEQTWTKTYKIGFANLNEGAETCKILGDFLEECCEAYGIDVIRVDNANDGAKAVSNVDYLISMGIEALVEFNVDQSVSEVIMNSANKANIPVMAIDIPHPGATFFGANNAFAGKLAGQALGQYAIDNWGGKYDCLLMVDQMASGELPRLRVSEAVTGMKEKFSDFSEDKAIIIEGGTDAQAAQRAVADFLSAHPDWHNILIVTLSSTTGVGTVAAIETAGREKDVCLVTNQEAYFFSYVSNHPEENFWHGCVTFQLMQYGQWIAPALREILDTGKQPESIYVDHQICTRSNIDELFPDWREKLAAGVYPK